MDDNISILIPYLEGDLPSYKAAHRFRRHLLSTVDFSLNWEYYTKNGKFYIKVWNNSKFISGYAE